MTPGPHATPKIVPSSNLTFIHNKLKPSLQNICLLKEATTFLSERFQTFLQSHFGQHFELPWLTPQHWFGIDFALLYRFPEFFWFCPPYLSSFNFVLPILEFIQCLRFFFFFLRGLFLRPSFNFYFFSRWTFCNLAKKNTHSNSTALWIEIQILIPSKTNKLVTRGESPLDVHLISSNSNRMQLVQPSLDWISA